MTERTIADVLADLREAVKGETDDSPITVPVADLRLIDKALSTQISGTITETLSGPTWVEIHIGGMPRVVGYVHPEPSVRPMAPSPRKAKRIKPADLWAIPCGCSAHGDHMGCEKSCRQWGCTHPLKMAVVVRTEAEADAIIIGDWKPGDRFDNGHGWGGRVIGVEWQTAVVEWDDDRSFQRVPLETLHRTARVHQSH